MQNLRTLEVFWNQIQVEQNLKLIRLQIIVGLESNGIKITIKYKEMQWEITMKNAKLKFYAQMLKMLVFTLLLVGYGCESKICFQFSILHIFSKCNSLL